MRHAGACSTWTIAEWASKRFLHREDIYCETRRGFTVSTPSWCFEAEFRTKVLAFFVILQKSPSFRPRYLVRCSIICLKSRCTSSRDLRLCFRADFQSCLGVERSLRPEILSSTLLINRDRASWTNVGFRLNSSIMSIGNIPYWYLSVVLLILHMLNHGEPPPPPPPPWIHPRSPTLPLRSIIPPDQCHLIPCSRNLISLMPKYCFIAANKFKSKFSLIPLLL